MHKIAFRPADSSGNYDWGFFRFFLQCPPRVLWRRNCNARQLSAGFEGMEAL